MIPLIPFFILASGGLWAQALTSATSNAQIAGVYLGIIILAALVRSSASGVEGIDWYLLPVCVLGPLGVVAAGTTYIVLSLYKVDQTRLNEWYEELRSGGDGATPRSFASDVSLGRICPQPSANMRPAVEIFREGTFKERQKVLLWIARRKDLSLKSLLEHAIRCDDTIIRSQAASLIVHFEAAERDRSRSA